MLNEDSLNFRISLVAGATAGVTEIMTMYPLDVVKTRFQIQIGLSEYTSIIDCFRKMIKNEGFGSLYRGILPPIFVEAPKRAIKFGANAEFRELYAKHFALKDGVLAAMLTGSSAGFTEALIVTTPDLITIRMQDKRNRGYYKGPLDVISKIFKADGVFGLARGIEATIWRQTVWNIGFFGIISFIRDTLPETTKEGTLLGNNFIAGSIGGTCGTVLNTPFDVAKTRIQSQRAAPFRYRWALPSVVMIAKEEGFKALYKGFVPKVLRLGPGISNLIQGGGILLVVYDFVSGYLRRKAMLS